MLDSTSMMASTLRGCHGSSGAVTSCSPVRVSFVTLRSRLASGLGSPLAWKVPGGDNFTQEDRCVGLADLMFMQYPGDDVLCAQEFLDGKYPVFSTNLLKLVILNQGGPTARRQGLGDLVLRCSCGRTRGRGRRRWRSWLGSYLCLFPALFGHHPHVYERGLGNRFVSVRDRDDRPVFSWPPLQQGLYQGSIQPVLVLVQQGQGGRRSNASDFQILHQARPVRQPHHGLCPPATPAQETAPCSKAERSLLLSQSEDALHWNASNCNQPNSQASDLK